MNFSAYMDAWLYGEQGYYSHYRKIGKGGDFYTAVSSSKFFGGSIAHFFLKRYREGHFPKDTTICEIGAHKGYLLADMIEFIYTLEPELLKDLEFVVVERFEHLKSVQQEYFKSAFGDAISFRQVSSLDELDVEHAFFVANEIFDAFSCELIHKGKLARVEEHKIVFDVEDEALVKKAASWGQDKGELACGYEDFALSMAQAAQKSEFVTFDYGHMVPRFDFSIRIYKEHEVFALFDESIKIGDYFAQSDITYDVNFTHLKEAYEAAGFRMLDFSTQLKALVDFGILDLLEMVKKHASEQAYMIEVGKVKTLIDPTIMGERFKMIHFQKA